MHKKIGWYLTELESRLRGRMPAEEVARFVSEVEDHLMESAEEFESEMGGRAAEEAVTRFGRPATLAHRVLQARFVPPRYWRAATPVMVLILVLVCSLAAWNSFDDVRVLGAPVPQVLANLCILPLLAALSFARQRVTLALAIAATLGSLCAAAILAATTVRVELDLRTGGTPATVQMPLRGLDRKLDFMAGSARSANKMMESLFNAARDSYEDPLATYARKEGTPPFRVPVDAFIDGVGVSTGEVRAFRTMPEAQVAWWNLGRAAMEKWRASSGVGEALVQKIRTEAGRPWAPRFAELLLGSLLQGVPFLVFLVALNEFALLLGRGLRYRRRREFT